MTGVQTCALPICIEAIVTSASPYTGEQRLDDVRRAAERLASARVDLVWMTCVGMDEAMREVVCEVTGRPVVLARSMRNLAKSPAEAGRSF